MTIFAKLVAVLLLVAPAVATDFEVPPAETAADSLPPELASGPNFHVTEPVVSDGLMHHYLLDSRYGTFPAYGIEMLKIRVREMAALAQIAKTSDVGVVAKSAARGVVSDAKSVQQVATHPVDTVVGIPQGVKHLFGGYKAQAAEVDDEVKKQVHSASSSSGKPSGGDVAKSAKKNATKYADRYLGISKAERAYYAQLNVDPSTNNAVLRKAIHHLAQIDATTSLGMHFVGVPGLPYLGDVQRALSAIYTEDPAVLRARQRKSLQAFGLSPDEVGRFEDAILLSPTRQALLLEDAKLLDGVEGRDELFRHATSVTTEEEMQVFIQSCRLLARVHGLRPLQRIVAGVRVPAGVTADGHVLVVGAFDAVYWTQEVDAYEAELHALLPAGANGMEVWLSGRASPRAQSELRSRGWEVHDNAGEAVKLP